MIDTLRRYWIGLLVLVLIGLHATIVAVIRLEANQARAPLSCEVELGEFYLSGSNSTDASNLVPVHLRLHALVPVNHRMQGRQVIEQNIFQVRQAIEEFCRQASPELLADPLLVELRDQIIDVLVQTVGETSCEDIVITEVLPSKDVSPLIFGATTSHGHSKKKMVITRQAKDEARKAAHEAESHDDAGHGAKDAHGGGHADAHGGGHGGH